jgi:hypothetical protein
MYAVSETFKSRILDPKEKKYGKVVIDYTDPFLDQSITENENEQANISYPEQTTDGIEEPFAKIAALDGKWVLGSDFALAPESAEENKQMGWWSAQLSDASGNFTIPYPILTIEFFARPVRSLSVVGDSKREEYPVDFEIKLYDGTETLLYTKTVTGNTLIRWEEKLTAQISGVTKLTLTISKWSKAGCHSKILECFTSIQETYYDNDLFLISLVEERETSQGSLPVGNISSNEIEVRLNNADGKFDAGNSASRLYGLLKKNRRIHAWLGVDNEDRTDVEWVPLGVFWSGGWSAPEDSVYASTTGRDRLDLLRNTNYQTGTVQENATVYDLAEAILTDAGLTSGEYWLDEGLEDFIIPYAYFDIVTHREALRLLAEACLGQVYCDREGKIRFESKDYLDNNETVDRLITPAMYFKKDNPVSWGSIANYIEVETQPLVPASAAEEVYRSNNAESIGALEYVTLTVNYNSVPCKSAIASLEDEPSGCVIYSANFYAWGAEITVYSLSAGTFTLVVNAIPLSVKTSRKVVCKGR